MIAFRIQVDDGESVVAGVEDWSVLSFHVNAIRAESGKNPVDDLDCSVGGLTIKNDEGVRHHFRWPRIPLSVGSRISITIVDADSPDQPTKRFRSDQEVQESPFTEEELREFRWKDYLELKKEFEGGTEI